MLSFQVAVYLASLFSFVYSLERPLPLVPLPNKPHQVLSQPINRLIIIGDIHGCLLEFQNLLTATNFSVFNNDHVVLVGDMITKGPESIEVIEFVRNHPNIHSVRGNHEDKAINAYYHRQQLREECNDEALDNYKSSLVYVDNFALDSIQWMEQLPYTLQIPQYEAIVVHAGLLPNKPLEEQDPFEMSSMRNILVNESTNTFQAIERATEGEQWSSVYDAYDRVFQPTTQLYFGHDPGRFPQNSSPSATCLDSGCVKGKRLTAVVLQEGSEPEMVSVSCKRLKKDKKKKKKKAKDASSE